MVIFEILFPLNKNERIKQSNHFKVHHLPKFIQHVMLYPHRYIVLNISFNSISFDYEIMNVMRKCYMSTTPSFHLMI